MASSLSLRPYSSHLLRELRNRPHLQRLAQGLCLRGSRRHPLLVVPLGMSLLLVLLPLSLFVSLLLLLVVGLMLPLPTLLIHVLLELQILLLLPGTCPSRAPFERGLGHCPT